MSTAQVVNTGVVNNLPRVALSRSTVASTYDSVDAIEGSFPTPTREQTARYAESRDDFEGFRRRRQSGPFQDRVISFGGVLVSREVGTTIMQAQAAAAASANVSSPLQADAERGIAVYEFNQALMGAAEAVTSNGITH